MKCSESGSIYYGERGVRKNRKEELEPILKIGWTKRGSDIRAEEWGLNLFGTIEGGKRYHESRVHKYFKSYRNYNRHGREWYIDTEKIHSWFEVSNYSDLCSLKPCDQEYGPDCVLELKNFNPLKIIWDEKCLTSSQRKFIKDLGEAVEKVEKLEGNKEKLSEYLKTIPDHFSTAIMRLGTKEIKKLRYNGLKIYNLLRFGHYVYI